MCTDISKSQQQVIFPKKKKRSSHKCYVAAENEERMKRIYIFLPLVLYYIQDFYVYVSKTRNNIEFCSLFFCYSLALCVRYSKKRKKETKKKVHKKFMSDFLLHNVL